MEVATGTASHGYDDLRLRLALGSVLLAMGYPLVQRAGHGRLASSCWWSVRR